MPGLDGPVTRRELRAELETVLKTLATKEDLKGFATKEDLREMRDELRTHFEDGHGARLLSLEGRVTHLENRRK